MNILLVNDDGYEAQGILLLKKELLSFGTVYTIAPRKAMSGKACSINMFEDAKDATYEKIDEYNYILEGTPADCVLFGLKILKLEIDFVVSGCNHGLNYSYYTLYSGTLGACMQSLRFRVPAIAFSVTCHHFDHISKYTKEVMNYILDNNLISKDYIISVNFPYTDEAKGIKVSRLDFNDFDYHYDYKDGCLYADDDQSVDFKNKDGDLYHTSNGYISLVPLSFSLFNNETYDKFLANLYGTKTLETNRLILRKFTLEDVDECYLNWFTSQNVTKFMTWYPHQNKEVSREIINSWIEEYSSNNSFNWVIVNKTNTDPIGSISFVLHKDGSYEMGYCLTERFWHQGIMSEAVKRCFEYLFEEVKINKIVAKHDIHNPHSGMVMKKCGMHFTNRQKLIIKEKIVTLNCYELNRSEYENNFKTK